MLKEWEKKYSQLNKMKHSYKSNSGIRIKPLYTPSDTNEVEYDNDLGFPGKPPFVRGVYPTMYHGRPWTMRQLAGFGPPEETNKRYKFLLKEGATGINGVFDYPTLRGYDSTDPIARADVGRGGVAIDSLEDMERLFDGIPVDEISVSLVTCQPIGNISIQAMYFAMAEERGIDLNVLAGTSQNDFLMETAISLGFEELPPPAAFRLSCDAIEFCTKHATRWNPINIDAYAYRETRLSAIQEVAIGLSHAMACVKDMKSRGLDVDDFAPRLSLFFSAHSDFFEEIAKYRAARKIWSGIMKERFQAKEERSCRLRFNVQTAGSTLTAQQPLNNITRSAYQALAAVLGGVQSLHVNGYDEAICSPTEEAALIALRSQQILLHETNVVNTIDPLGGSYFVESLTFEMEKKIKAYMKMIEDMGGIVKTVETGWLHSEISDCAFKYQKAVENGEIKVVGLNCFTVDEEIPREIFIDPETRSLQKKRLEKLKKERDGRKVRNALDDIKKAAEKGENLMPYTIKSAKAKVTIGEVSKTLREVFGTWSPSFI